MLAYRLQSDAFGDLDKSIRRNLRSEKDDGSGVPFDRRAPQTRQGVALKAGALLVREWKGRLAPQIAAAPPPPLHLVEARLVAPSVIDPRWASRSRVGDGGGVFEAMGAGSGLSYQLGGPAIQDAQYRRSYHDRSLASTAAAISNACRRQMRRSAMAPRVGGGG